MLKEQIDVSPEMLTFVGKGPIAPTGWPVEAAMLRFYTLESGAAAVDLVIDPRAEDGTAVPLVFLVAIEACERLFAAAPLEDGSWHLPSDLNSLALAIKEGSSDAAGVALRLARSIELLCGVFAALAAGTLISAAGNGHLSESDARRIAAARTFIDEHWSEKLTLDKIARECGINRAKLTREFRQIYQCTIADAIVERRLTGARDMLLSTSLPVSSIGYACGYLSNASFTRAFTRYFGMAPSQMRVGGAAS